MKVCKAYVDGSFTPKVPGKSGWGCVFRDDEGEIYESQGVIDDEQLRQIAGEVQGAIVAIESALSYGAEKLTIFHDYIGLAHWAKDEWKANKPLTQRYKVFCQKAKATGLQLNFIKVKPEDNRADTLATGALGIKSVH
jgi:ribonuclease HI